MVFRKISKDIKNWAISLYNQGLVPRDIRDLLGISSRSLSRWRHNEEVYGSTLPPLEILHKAASERDEELHSGIGLATS
ncbi:hypothetical protein BDM02DRAFT_3096536 [Thelephora ganbajun]|uniref:Uncharacterized protein n=1 Tax=Thelephora ganbajun TaxID=370292 RepID=A0ACB6ZFS2_THEGA|nr:hypothetical protein BDM02DRAFT_3096536 [Thelephora ganbajun]